MKQAALIGALVVAVGGYIWWSMSSESIADSARATTTSTTTAIANGSEASNPNAGTTTPTPVAGVGIPPVTNPTVQPAPASGYKKDGTFTGPIVASIYGPVQASITIKSGKIVVVDVPVYPNKPGNTTVISNHAIPILKQEVIVAQSAKIDMISGATQTVEAFQQSLTVALAQAS